MLSAGAVLGAVCAPLRTLFGAAPPSRDDNAVVIEVSPTDDRTYRHVRLSSGISIVLCSDCTAEKASAAVCVDAGASSDPENIQGVAHFTEHMVLLGSVQYPAESWYKKSVSQAGGVSNASTSMLNTTFRFEVIDEALESILDVLVSLLHRPLFTASASERELNAVDAENGKNLTLDSRRELQISKHCGRDHPYLKFSTGDSNTLAFEKGTLDAVAAFHKQ
jgi:insulysin